MKDKFNNLIFDTKMKFFTEVLPKVRVKSKFYWWIIRYGGKKRIPKEVVFASMTKSLQRMNDNMEKALEISVDEGSLSSSETKQVQKALKLSVDLEENIQHITRKN